MQHSEGRAASASPGCNTACSRRASKRLTFDVITGLCRLVKNVFVYHTNGSQVLANEAGYRPALPEHITKLPNQY
eukprot:131828-Amphidinium_carterae.1